MSATPFDIRSARRGFSLAELVVVMAIISTLGAIAVPRFAKASATYRADGAARALAATIERAAAEARARSATVRFQADASNNTYHARDLTDAAPIFSGSTETSPFSAQILSVRTKNGGDILDIDGFGEFSGAVVVEIGAGSRLRCAWVDPDAGTVHIGTVSEAELFMKSDRYR